MNNNQVLTDSIILLFVAYGKEDMKDRLKLYKEVLRPHNSSWIKKRISDLILGRQRQIWPNY